MRKIKSIKRPNRLYDLLPQAFGKMIRKYFFMKTRNKSKFTIDNLSIEP